jgi:hypothetical protein
VRDDGAEDIDVVRGSEPLDGGVKDLAWIWQGGVVHDDRGASWSSVPLRGAPAALKIRSSVSR